MSITYMKGILLGCMMLMPCHAPFGKPSRASDRSPRSKLISDIGSELRAIGDQFYNSVRPMPAVCMSTQDIGAALRHVGDQLHQDLMQGRGMLALAPTGSQRNICHTGRGRLSSNGAAHSVQCTRLSSVTQAPVFSESVSAPLHSPAFNNQSPPSKPRTRARSDTF